MFPLVVLNWAAIILATIVSSLIGSLWFSPKLFGNTWMKSLGWNMKDMEKQMKKMSWNKMARSYAGIILGTFITAFVLSILIHVFGATSFTDASEIGILVWVGFIATTKLPEVFFEGKNFDYYVITVMYSFVSIIAMAWIIAAWF